VNWLIYTADRSTHLKVLMVGFTAALVVAVIGISAHKLTFGTAIMTARAPTVIKAGEPVNFTDRNGPVVR
jgi:hypothetical protein